MATCLQLPMAPSYSIPSSMSTSLTSSKNRVSSLKTRFVVNSIPLPPINPNDPFLKKLASVATTTSPETSQHPKGSDTLPFMDIFGSPNRPPPTNARMPANYSGSKRRNRPPDLASEIFERRIVYIGMPLFPEVSELVIQQLIYLQWMDSKAPIYIYINSTGTALDDDGLQPIAVESQGFAIYDTMMLMKNEIHTLGLGIAGGHACLILSAGTKGKRLMLPHSRAVIYQAQVPQSGLMPASDIAIRTREAVQNRNTMAKLLAEHTGNSEETVANVMKPPFCMDAIRAKEFGVIDRILLHGKEQIMKDVRTPEDWD